MIKHWVLFSNNQVYQHPVWGWAGSAPGRFLLSALLSALINFSRTKFQLKGVCPVFKIPSGCRDALVQAGAPEGTLEGPLPWGDIWGQLCPMPPKGGCELTPASQSLGQNISDAIPSVSLTVRVKDLILSIFWEIKQ